MATEILQPAGGPSTRLETTSEAKEYQRLKLTASISSLVLGLIFFVAMAVYGGPRLDAAIRPVVGDNPWIRLISLGFLYAAFLELLSLPINFWSGFILEHRYHLSNQSLAAWVWRQIKGYLVGGPIGLVMLLGLYALIWYTGAWWWLWAAAGLLVITVILGKLFPVLILPIFYKTKPLEDPTLRDRLVRLAEGTGVKIEGVYRLQLSADTKKANAALAGLGRTRRVLLGDTLLAAFTAEEIEVVFAHELAHHLYRHLLKAVGLNVILAGAGFWLADFVLKSAAQRLGYPSGPLPAYADPAALPLLICVLSFFGLLLSPAENALSRYFERQCDWYALRRTGLVDAYRSAFTKLAQINKADTDPHPLVVWLFDDHPPIRERLAMAEEAPGSGSQLI